MASEAQNPMSKFKGADKLHVAMFPWLAFGHILPFLELSKFLASKGHKITFISTPRNIDRLPKLPPDLASSIIFLKLSLPQVDGLPPNAEATMDVHTDDVPFLKKAYDGLEPELTRFLENSVLDFIIYDFAPHWLPQAAAKLRISCAYFSIINAWPIAFLGPVEFLLNGSDPRTRPEDFLVPPKWVPFENKVAYRLFEINSIMGTQGAVQENALGVSDVYRVAKVSIGCDAILIRHCHEFEGDWLSLLEELHHKPVIPLGLMPPPLEVGSAGDDKDETWASIKTWLDSQSKGSVVYVALGSELSLSQLQLTELALGLELSGVPFFWALRKPAWSTKSDSIEPPDGFEERVKGRGVVWTSWAPQMKILSHDSVGGFLTHCGWSSCVEGLVFGHPLIMLPFVLDQGLNARVLEDNQVGVEVPRNEQDGSYTRNSVADSVRLVMDENCGKLYKEKAKEVSRIFGDRELHYNYLQNAF